MFSVFTKIPISAVKLLDSRKNTSLRTNQKDLASFVDPFVLWLSKYGFNVRNWQNIFTGQLRFVHSSQGLFEIIRLKTMSL